MENIKNIIRVLGFVLVKSIQFILILAMNATKLILILAFGILKIVLSLIKIAEYN